MSTITELTCKPGEVAVRAFCQGLGDCFLIGLGLDDGTTFKIVVDCGVIIGTPNAKSLLSQVVDGLFASTGGGKVDALVITHEHWDHVGGFSLVEDQWAKFAVKEVWLAWTENRPTDTFAQQLYDEKSKAATKLTMALQNVQNKLTTSMGMQGEDEARQEWKDSTEYLAFLGLDSDQTATALNAGETPLGKTAEALNMAKKLGQNRTFYPGNVEKVGNHFEIAFLGPPHDEMIKKPDDPGGKHTYKNQTLGMDDDGMDAEYLSDVGPFDFSYQIDYTEFAAAAGRSPSLDLLTEYESEPVAWRKLDLDANRLALDLDAATNNTSLVFAISVPGDAPKCLLFVADAQVGNWLSWSKQTYPIQGKDLTIDDIFAQTVFYKVGHHGSHNATLRDRGLELMTHPDLSGFLPLDEDIAHNKKHWPMPWPALYSALKAKTGNRLGRSDMAEPVDASFVPAPVAFQESFGGVAGATPRPIYLEWRVGG